MTSAVGKADHGGIAAAVGWTSAAVPNAIAVMAV
jgi:hypothetical protein